ncbi:short-chain fatty acid transporter [Nocardioides cheoyonin]|uniref:short-chain fatty acid transporter n=1 Tax=Nocardioides cheoyonin TaxID=3156615 RepID=UPI0032B57C90
MATQQDGPVEATGVVQAPTRPSGGPPPPGGERRGPLERVAEFFTSLTERFVPDPFVLALGLTLLVAVLALVIEQENPVDLVTSWGDGFWNLLEFTMQMALVLATGFVLAHTPPVQAGINAVADRLATPRQAVMAATAIGAVGSYINWGFGLVVGGVVATKFALRVSGVHYPLIIASAYSGFTLWALGLSASIPVTISTKGHPLEAQMGLIPLSRTIWSWPMGLTALAILVLLLTLNPMLHPKDPSRVVEIDRSKHAEEPPRVGPPPGPLTVAERLNHSRVIGTVAGLCGLLYLVIHFAKGNSLDINSVNFTMLFVGLLFMGTPARYLAAMADGVKTISGIVLQYPFYAGIMAIMTASGLVVSFGDWMSDIASAGTLPFLGFLVSFVLNFVAPSGGGHWVIQGPFTIEAAKALGSDYAQNAMAVQLGNAWNDIIQPLWILPVLALSKLKLKDIMGYLVIIMVACGVVYAVAVLLWGVLAA